MVVALSALQLVLEDNDKEDATKPMDMSEKKDQDVKKEDNNNTVSQKQK